VWILFGSIWSSIIVSLDLLNFYLIGTLTVNTLKYRPFEVNNIEYI